LVEEQLVVIQTDNFGGLQTFHQILAHEGPLLVKNPKYKGSSYNLLIEWDSEEPTWELLNIIAADDKVMCALYGEANNMLDKKGWKSLKKAAKNIQKVYTCVHKTMKNKQEPKYKYSICLPQEI
jgi:hypothetical protein